MRRRDLLGSIAAAGFTGCATKTAKVVSPSGVVPRLAAVNARMDRVFRTTVCLRPFRAAGPRIEAEKIGEKLVVHNYGHGGSGWSLSWGSSNIAVDKALATGEKDVAVIGCGALGLTSATLLQRAGAKVTIYAKERPPEVRSARATGSWTPDSRVSLTNAVSADFPALWEKMARYSFHTYESYLGMAGNPIEWRDNYFLSDEEGGGRGRSEAGGLDFASYRDRIADITPRRELLGPGAHAFPTKYASKAPSLTFNVAGYSRQLVNDFLLEGGKIERADFRTPADLGSLPQKTIINASGYGARALFNDQSIVPVRGQITWLIPQPEVDYSVMYKGVYVLSRRDGIVVQSIGSGEMEGYNVADEQPDSAESSNAIRVAADLFSRMR